MQRILGHRFHQDSPPACSPTAGDIINIIISGFLQGFSVPAAFLWPTGEEIPALVFQLFLPGRKTGHNKTPSTSKGVIFPGSPGRTRTADQVVNSHPLYLLSYRGMKQRLYNITAVAGQVFSWLGDEDSNLGKQIQSLLSCR